MPSTWTQNKYISAYFFAAEAFNQKCFPGTNLPYLVHVSLVSMEVMATLCIESELDGDLAVQCALLHDVIEDGVGTFEKIKEEFGEQVARGVQALTKNKGLSNPMEDSINRIKAQGREIQIVKMADRITNLLPPPKNWTPNRIEVYKHESIMIYNSLKDASDFLAERLNCKIQNYEKYLNF